MICKYCGNQYNGNRCSVCGKVIPLTKRSTELDSLMSGTKMQEQKTFEQGVKEGYQKGLKEGYDNGYNEGKTAAIPPNEPTRPRKKWIVILCATTFAFGAALSGFLCSTISYNNGHKQGFSSGETEGIEEGIRIAQSTYQPLLEERYQEGLTQGRVERYQTGFDEANSTLAEPTDTPIPSPEQDNEELMITPRPTENQELDFPYSRARNEKDEDNFIVRKIQIRLKDLGIKVDGKVIGVDGKFGPQTEKAVMAFQRSILGLTVNGEVDIETYLCLFPDEKIGNEESSSSENTEEQETEKPQLPLGAIPAILSPDSSPEPTDIPTSDIKDGHDEEINDGSYNGEPDNSSEDNPNIVDELGHEEEETFGNDILI